MSWGERSCKKYRNGCEIASMKTCNVSCIDYESNGKKPDSETTMKIIRDTKEPKDLNNEVTGNVLRSTLPKFSKGKEFVVLKKHIFNIQSISPKKIILKFKGMTTKENPLPDGIFVIKGD